MNKDHRFIAAGVRAGLLATAACAVTLMGAGSANAQTAAPVAAAPDAAASGTGEIIVTAQKRAQNLQSVPLAVNVVTGAQLQANGVQDFADLNRVAPSLTVRPAENPVNADVSIRGVGTFAFAIGVEPSVAVVVDDVPISFQARAFADLSDIERIEVLRGPQSTLYGKSASAGLINIVTPPPSKTFTAKVTALGTTDAERQFNAVLSGPITSNLGFRSANNYDKYDGNVHNLADGKKVNGRRIASTRNKLVWTPTPELEIAAGADYINGRTTIGRPFIRVDPNADLRGIPSYPVSVFAPGINIGPNNTDVSNNLTSGTRYHDFAQSLHISYDTGGPTLMSISSHDKFWMHDTLDQDESAIPGYSNYQDGKFTSRQWTEEFRIVSPSHQRFRYTLGLFYSNVDFTRPFFRGPIYSLSHILPTAGDIQEAGFGQLEYDILPHTTLIGGGRYAHEKVSYTFRDFNAGTYFAGHDGDSFGTYKLGVQQHLTDDIMAFLTYATGHKGETYDLSSGFNQNRADAGPVKPETSKDWELGARTQFFDHRLTLNVTLFDTHYRNFQAQGIETLPDGTTNFRLANVGKLRTRGVEVEATGRIERNLSVGAGVTYDDAKITDFPLAQCYAAQTAAEGCVPLAGTTPAHQDLSGSRAPQAPEWKVTANFDYSHDLGALPFQAIATGALTYQSKQNFSLSADPETEQGGYAIVNVSVGIRQPEHKYEATLFVNNLFDKHYYENMTDSRGNYNNLLATQSYLPRDFRRYGGIRVSYSF